MKCKILYKAVDAQINSYFINHLIEKLQNYQIEASLLIVDDIIGGKNLLCEDYLLDATFVARFLEELDGCQAVINRTREYQIGIIARNNGMLCFNDPFTCKLGNDKYEAYCFMKENGIPVMETSRGIAEYTDRDLPFVIKSVDGHGGKEVYLIDSIQDYDRFTDSIKNAGTNRKQDSNRYISQSCVNNLGRDLRVYVVGGKVVAAMLRISDTDFRSNYSLGGSCEIHELSDTEKSLVRKIIDLLQPDYAGIDFIYHNGQPVFNEIEDMVGARMLYQHTDIDPACIFAKHIYDSIKNTLHNDKSVVD